MNDKQSDAPAVNSSDDAAVEQAMTIIDGDPVSAAAQLKVLANRGSPRAMAYLGCLHQQGIGVPVNLDEAESVYQRAEASGVMEGVFGRGQLSLLRKDYGQARLFFTTALAGGFDEAREALRQLDEFERDVRLEGQVDAARNLEKTEPMTAFALTRALAEQGSLRAIAQLAQQYHNGTGTPVSLSEAEMWYRRVADRAWGDAKVRAIHNLGWLYEERDDLTRALAFFQQGAELRYPPSVCHLGYIFWRGLGVEKDPAKARALFERAVAAGNLAAQKFLSVQLLSGQFGLRNVLRGFALYLRTAWTIIVKIPYGYDRIRM